VVVNAVTTLDGKVSRGGKSSGIGSDTDRRVMRVIRSRTDAVLVGAGTIRAERLSLTVPDDLADWRESRGESRQPLGVVLSRKGDLQERKLSEISSNPLMLTGNDLEGNAGGSTADYLRLLYSRYEVRRILVEGGPTVNHSLFRERLVDELFITLSPKLYAGDENNLLKGISLEDPVPQPELLSTFLCEEELFLRYSFSASFR
jgi:2,5-diamino-6-(ribosylamino)-4(3H)-pyrimidinone 5'-phosphate reductase